MTRKEALTVRVGDILIYSNYYAFKVVKISYVEPCNTLKTPIMFHDGKGGAFIHRKCRCYDILHEMEDEK